MKRFLIFATLALIAAACSSAPQTANTVDPSSRILVVPSFDSSKYEVAGMLEVTVSDFKPNSSEGTATAKFFAADKSGKLSSKGLLVPNSSVAFTPQFVSSFDSFSGPTTTRYIQAGFAITNNSPTTYYNMTMVASSLATATTSSGVVTTVGGTALSDI
jgi:opacity protein-like surface antigen